MPQSSGKKINHPASVILIHVQEVVYQSIKLIPFYTLT